METPRLFTTTKWPPLPTPNLHPPTSALLASGMQRTLGPAFEAHYPKPTRRTPHAREVVRREGVRRREEVIAVEERIDDVLKEVESLHSEYVVVKEAQAKRREEEETEAKKKARQFLASRT